MATYSLTIAALGKAPKLDSFELSQVLNGRDSLTCDIYSADGSYRPAPGAAVLFSENATTLFGGPTITTTERWAGDKQWDGIFTRIECRGNNATADTRTVNTTIASGLTLKQVLTNLSAFYPAGVTLDAGQANGPTIDEELTFSGQNLSAVLDRLTSLTGWVWNIDGSKKLKMYEPGTVACPIDLIESGGTVTNAVGDVIVKRTKEGSANRVIVRYGNGVQDIKGEVHEGDGVTRVFTLDVPMYPILRAEYPAPGRVTEVNGTQNVLNSPIGIFPDDDLAWNWESGTNQVHQDPDAAVLEVGQQLLVDYGGQFPVDVVAEDLADQATNGIQEVVISQPDVFDRAVALQIAQDELAKRLEHRIEVRFKTRELGILPGQTLTITIPTRDVDDDFLIQEVKTRHLNQNSVIREVVCVQGETFRGTTWRNTVKNWSSTPATLPILGDAPSPAAITVQQNLCSYGAIYTQAFVHGDGPKTTTSTSFDKDVHGFDPLYPQAEATEDVEVVEGVGFDGENVLDLHSSSPNEFVDAGWWERPGNWNATGGFRVTWRNKPTTEMWDESGFEDINLMALMDHDSAFTSAATQAVFAYLTIADPDEPRVALTYQRYNGGTPQIAGDAFPYRPVPDLRRAVTENQWLEFEIVGRPGTVTGSITSVASDGYLHLRFRNLDSGGPWIEIAKFQNIDFIGNTDTSHVNVMNGWAHGYHGMFGQFTKFQLETVTCMSFIESATVTLDNDDIKALPTTPITLVAAPGSGKFISWMWAELVSDFSAGAYTNINATYAQLQIAGASGGNYSTGVTDDSTTTPALTLLSSLLAGADKRIRLVPILTAVGTGEAYINPAQNATGVDTQANIVNAALQIAIDNNGSGALTGGNAANTLKVTVYYVVGTV